MEETIYFMLCLLICFSWVGIGFISSIILSKAWYTEREIEKISIFVRACWVIYWPVLLLAYIFRGIPTKM